MSRFFPHSSHAESQPLAHTLLWSHVLFRGFQTGATLGLVFGGIQTSYLRLISKRANVSALPLLLRSTALSSIAFTALMVPGMFYHMHGREEIEWEDRSWRLLESEGQKETDDWSLIGAGLGGVLGARGKSGLGLGLRVAGGAGIGTMVGVVGYLGWRYGINGGKRRV